MPRNLMGFMVVLVVLAVIVGVSMRPSEEAAKEREAARQDKAQKEHISWILSEFKYFKDPRTNLCFVYFWQGGTGGPALATVPCESVPAQLFTPAK